MSRYVAPVSERVACAKSVQAKVTGVHQIQPAREKAETVEEFLARGGVIDVLPSYGNMFPFDQLVGVPNG